MKNFTKTYLVVMRIVALISAVLMAVTTCILVGMSIFSMSSMSSMTDMATQAGADAGAFSMIKGAGAVIIVPAIITLAITILDFVASSKFSKYSKMTDEELVAHKGAILAWGIVMAISLTGTVVGLIAVIACAILVNNYLAGLENPVVNETSNEDSQSQPSAQSSPSILDRTKALFRPKLTKQNEKLEQAKAMYENKQISKEEYDALRKKILEID